MGTEEHEGFRWVLGWAGGGNRGIRGSAGPEFVLGDEGNGDWVLWDLIRQIKVGLWYKKVR